MNTHLTIHIGVCGVSILVGANNGVRIPIDTASYENGSVPAW